MDPKDQAADRRKRARNPALYRDIKRRSHARLKLKDYEGYKQRQREEYHRNKEVIRVARRYKVARKVAKRWLAEGRVPSYIPGHEPKQKPPDSLPDWK